MITTTHDVSSTAQPVRRHILLILAMSTAFIGLDAFLIVPLMPTMAATSGFSPAIGGLLVTAYALMYALSAAIFGSFSDRVDRKITIALGMLVLAIGTLLTSLSASLPLLLLFRAITGLGAGILQPGVLAMTGDITSYEERGRAMGIVISGVVAGGTLGLPFGSFLAQWTSWHWSFRLIGLLALFMCVVIMLGLPKRSRSMASGDAQTRTIGQTLRAVFSIRSVFFALLVTLLWYGGLQGVFANLGAYYVENFHLQPGLLSLILLAAGIAGVVGGMLGGRAADRWGKRHMVMLACIGAVVMVIACTLSAHLLLAAIIVNTIWSAVFNVGQASLAAFISELRPELRGLVLSLNGSFMYIGSTLFTAGAAFILQAGGGFLGIACLNTLGNLIVLLVVRSMLTEQPQGKEV